MRILYIDCSAGVSGDMLLAGLIDIGLPPADLYGAVDRLGLRGIEIQLKTIIREGIQGTGVLIKRATGEWEPIPKGVGEWMALTDGSQLESGIKRSMIHAFRKLAQAEGVAHGRPWRKVAFHQIGAVDTWVSLVGFCVGLKHFGVAAVYPSVIPLGSRHVDPKGRGRFSPGPATRWLLRRFQTDRRAEPFEWTTPTGAMMLAGFASTTGSPPFTVLKIGHGVGSLRPPTGPALLRLILGEAP